jgi:hypothetical protein
MGIELTPNQGELLSLLPQSHYLHEHMVCPNESHFPSWSGSRTHTRHKEELAVDDEDLRVRGS